MPPPILTVLLCCHFLLASRKLTTEMGDAYLLRQYLDLRDDGAQIKESRIQPAETRDYYMSRVWSASSGLSTLCNGEVFPLHTHRLKYNCYLGKESQCLIKRVYGRGKKTWCDEHKDFERNRTPSQRLLAASLSRLLPPDLRRPGSLSPLSSSR
jgi:hypothetical protein